MTSRFTSILLAITLLCCLIFTFAAPPSPIGPPIPSLHDALIISGVDNVHEAKVIVDVWFDLTCSDSGDLWNDYWRTLMQYVQQEQLPVQFRIFNFPLPYHISAFEQLKAYLILKELDKKDNNNSSAGKSRYAYEFMDRTFSHQYPIFDSAVKGLNQSQIQALIYDTYVAPMKIENVLTRTVFMSKINSGAVWDHGRRVFKLATSNGIFGTPQFKINGVLSQHTDSFTMQDWLDLFKQLIGKH